VQQFRDAIESRDLDGLVGLFTDDVVFRSPVVHMPYRGRAQVETLLRAVSQVLEDFHYTRQIGAPDAADHALVFRARVGDREVEGCDFIHVDEDGVIDELYVMVRPLSGLLALAEAMKHQLASARTASMFADEQRLA
jgi:SnoaL-like domain